MYTKGAIMPSAPKPSRMIETTAPRLRRRRDGRSGCAGRALRTPSTVAPFIVDPPSPDAVLEGGHGQDDQEESDGDGRGVADLEVGERLLGEVHDDAARGVPRAAVRQHDDGLEDLERTDHGDGDVEEDRLRDHRDGDLAEHRDRSGAVE